MSYSAMNGVCIRWWEFLYPSLQRHYRRLILLLILLYCYMFRSYDHRQEENILLDRITQLTTDPLFYNIANIIVITFYIDIVAVMGDVFASVFNYHSPLSSKIQLSIQRGCNRRFLISRCWSVGYFFILWCYVYSGFRSYRSVFVLSSPFCGVSRLLVELLRVLVSLCVVSYRGVCIVPT
jgi:hypothetical protein